ncbi:hypothetical protein BCR32DRAFT_277474 [Anaeromyces robustus]|uniref:RGS domain-containing protein n=1 Tax=Anaeromyces robustus TaxID=1754192 RepID=A0A1Y1XE82_9FUNG|nr:hypothetical protein BCR32DRAFT_277474 [Anaeromyces robustus]|eukprot:ORX84017.1 hypothetical protein BCR32DRAFT_277474 [Anaeromyces robustus]
MAININIRSYIEEAREKDDKFEPDVEIELIILIVTLIYFIPSTIIYYKNRENVIIKYRQPRNVLIGSTLSTLNAALIPINRAFKSKCIVNVWVNSYLIFSFVLLTFSKYIKIFFIQRLSMFKLKFSEKKNEKIHEKGDMAITIYGKDYSTNLSSIKSISLSKEGFPSLDSFTLDNFTFDSHVISDPTQYFRRLNNTIDKNITLYFVMMPIITLLLYYFGITILYFDELINSHCLNERGYISLPKLLLNLSIGISSIYFFYQAYINQKWDKYIKIEYTLFVVVSAICSIVMQLALKGYFGDKALLYRIYIFQFIPISNHALNVDEFLARLSNSNFKAQVREIATQTFCIENLLFFEAHCDLMNIIITYYNKKSTQHIVESVYTFSEIMHRNTTNPVLYKPFERIFKKQYNQIYNLYIKKDGIASVNINDSTKMLIEEQILSDNYTYLMFNQAAEEIGDLLYENIYPRMNL